MAAGWVTPLVVGALGVPLAALIAGVRLPSARQHRTRPTAAPTAGQDTTGADCQTCPPDHDHKLPGPCGAVTEDTGALSVSCGCTGQDATGQDTPAGHETASTGRKDRT